MTFPLSRSAKGFNTDEVTRYYDRIASEYDAYYHDGISTAENMVLQKMLGAVISPASNVLDLGCGTGLGYQLVRAIKPNIRYCGVDISRDMIAEAKQNLGLCAQAHVFVGDIMKLRELQDDSFEAVISLFGSFSHAEDPERACAEITRVAKPGALILIMVYSRFSLRNIIAALGEMSLSPLLRTRPYYVRNATHGLINGAPAHFFTAGDLRKLFTRFENVRVFGLNAILETGLARAAFSRASAEFCSRLLLREQTLIASLPSAAHSLILIGRKPVSNDTTQALSIAA